LIDDLATFVSALPSWVDDDGLPLSYRHFRYGMAWINRQDARLLLRDAAAARLAQAPRADYGRERRGILERLGDG